MTVSEKERLIADLRLASTRIGAGPVATRLNKWIDVIFQELKDSEKTT